MICPFFHTNLLSAKNDILGSLCFAGARL